MAKSRYLKPLSITPGLGSSWNDNAVIVRYQPWESESRRWFCQYPVFGGSFMTREAPDLKHLRWVVPFSFTLGRKSSEVTK